MHIITDSNIPFLDQCGLTIGTFDGVHLGHIFLLRHLRKLCTDHPLVVYTFTNHPSHVLSHLPPIPFLYTIEHKLKILKEHGVDYTLLSPFTKEVANTPYDQFLSHLKKALGFSYLVLGEEAAFGKDKEGTKENVHASSATLGFHIDYVPKSQLDDAPLSSGRIRTLIAQGKFSEASRCLGRPYSIYAPVHFDTGQYHMPLWQICLPPTGSYPVTIVMHGETCTGKAHVDRKAEHIRFEAHYEMQSTYAEVIF